MNAKKCVSRDALIDIFQVRGLASVHDSPKALCMVDMRVDVLDELVYRLNSSSLVLTELVEIIYHAALGW